MKKIRAFSLLEMLVALAIIGILITIAYPSYTQYFLRQNRFTAETTLLKLASALEQFYNEHNSYQQATLDNLGFPATIANSYQLTIELATDTQYIISAEPINSQRKDTACYKLSLHSDGEKSISGDGNIYDCW